MDSFEILLEENRGAVERFVNFRINSKADAEDILQEIYFAAFRSFNRLSDKRLFKAWILGIARNKLNDKYREKARKNEISLDDVANRLVFYTRFGISESNPVRETLELLAENERKILYLYYFKEMPQADIAKHLGIPLGTVKSRLHSAKHSFRQKYPYQHYRNEGDNTMKKLPDIMPEYKITPTEKIPFDVIFEELPNWFIVPKLGEEANWACYDMPGRNISEKVHSKVTNGIVIHGVQGVEIATTSEFIENGKNSVSDDAAEHIYYAQLTDTHCRWLGESYIDRDGNRRILTFLDGDEFIDQWGFGENNCGNETQISAKGDVTRNGNAVTAANKKYLLDIVGRYNVEIGGRSFDTVCVMEIWEYGAATEQYLDKNGKTVLWRRFNRDDWTWERYGNKKWSEILPENERITINGNTYVHWYDSISDYVL